MAKKIYVVGGSNGYASFLNDYELVNNLEDANIVLFTGGEDVTPDLYKETKHPRTYCNPDRDNREKEIFQKIDPSKQIAVGICRGLRIVAHVKRGELSGTLKCQPAAKLRGKSLRRFND